MSFPVSPYPVDPAAAADRARPSAATRAVTAAAVAGALMVTVLVTREGDGDGIGVWLLGPVWYWLCLAAWALVSLAGAVAVWVAWRHWLPGALTLVLAAALWSVTTGIPPRAGLVHGPEAWFDSHRAEFDEAARWGQRHCCQDDYLGDDLPDPLRHLSLRGTVTGRPGALFLAQWYGIPDDAGGYWYSPDRSPAGYDMFGMPCQDPTLLGDGWWSCAM